MIFNSCEMAQQKAAYFFRLHQDGTLEEYESSNSEELVSDWYPIPNHEYVEVNAENLVRLTSTKEVVGTLCRIDNKSMIELE